LGEIRLTYSCFADFGVELLDDDHELFDLMFLVLHTPRFVLDFRLGQIELGLHFLVLDECDDSFGELTDLEFQFFVLDPLIGELGIQVVDSGLQFDFLCIKVASLSSFLFKRGFELVNLSEEA
jgi:hypothetical protein